MSKRRMRVKAKPGDHDAGHGSSANGAEHTESAHEGGHEMQGTTAADHAEIAGLGRFLSRLLYTASYSVSYGVVFPVMFVAYSVPTENALVRGLVDGGRAARDSVAALYDDSAHAVSSESAPEAEHVPA